MFNGQPNKFTIYIPQNKSCMYSVCYPVTKGTFSLGAGGSLIWFCYINFIKIWMRINFYFVCQKLLDISGPRCSPEKRVSINNRDKSCSTVVIGNICYSFNVRHNSIRHVKKNSFQIDRVFLNFFKSSTLLLPITYFIILSWTLENLKIKDRFHLTLSPQPHGEQQRW